MLQIKRSKNIALLSNVRLLNKIRMMNIDDFKNIKTAICNKIILNQKNLI